MLYIASVPGFILALGMQFSVESPRWLCKVAIFIHCMFSLTPVAVTATNLAMGDICRLGDSMRQKKSSETYWVHQK